MVLVTGILAPVGTSKNGGMKAYSVFHHNTLSKSMASASAELGMFS